MPNLVYTSFAFSGIDDILLLWIIYRAKKYLL